VAAQHGDAAGDLALVDQGLHRLVQLRSRSAEKPAASGLATGKGRRPRPAAAAQQAGQRWRCA
jgi:hypothetical protein